MCACFGLGSHISCGQFSEQPSLLSDSSRTSKATRQSKGRRVGHDDLTFEKVYYRQDQVCYRPC